MNQHPDPIFTPVELAELHSLIMTGVDDLLDEEADASTGEVEDEEWADQIVLTLSHYIDIARKIEKRIDCSPTVEKYYGQRLKGVVG